MFGTICNLSVRLTRPAPWARTADRRATHGPGRAIRQGPGWQRRLARGRGRRHAQNLPVHRVEPVGRPGDLHAPSPTDADPLWLWFHCGARATVGGAFSQWLDLYDWRAGAYDTFGATTAPLTTSLAEQQTVARGDVTRFLGPNGEIKARVRADYARTPWSSSAP